MSNGPQRKAKPALPQWVGGCSIVPLMHTWRNGRFEKVSLLSVVPESWIFTKKAVLLTKNSSWQASTSDDHYRKVKKPQWKTIRFFRHGIVLSSRKCNLLSSSSNRRRQGAFSPDVPFFDWDGELAPNKVGDIGLSVHLTEIIQG